MSGFRSVYCLYLLAILIVFGTLCMLTFNYLPQISIMTERSDAPRNSVIVVGGGLAGLSATIEAVRHGAKVTIVEKEKSVGGNSAKATSGMNGVDTNAQKDLGISDSVTQFIEDTISSGDGLSDKMMVKTLAENSGAAIQFITDFGLNLTDVVQLGGHSTKRTHRFPPTKEGKPVPVGWTIISTLKKYVLEDLKDFVDVKTQASFVEFTKAENRVNGVKYKTSEGAVETVEGTVVITAGGYGNDHTEKSLLEKYTPHLAKYPTTNGPWATGDLIKATEGEGLSLVQMDKVQVHPTGFLDAKDPNNPTKFLAPEALRGCGGILLNAEGKRFANELGRRDYLTEKINSNCARFQNKADNPIVAAMLLSQQVIDKFGPHLAGFYIFKGLVNDVKTLSGAASFLGVSEGTLKDTVKIYKAQCEAGKDEYEKKAFPTCFDENDHFYVAYITPSLHYCMGGIQINDNAEVLQKAEGGEPKTVAGLFAAGEVTGGVHGNNRLGGNSLLECVVFGRIAGKNSAHFGQK